MNSVSTLRPTRFDGERRQALAFEIVGVDDLDRTMSEAQKAISAASEQGAALAYGLVAEDVADTVFAGLGCTSLGAAPELVRPLRLDALAERIELPAAARRYLPRVPLLLPFGRRRRSGVREILVDDPRVTRLWDRFSIDIGVGIERNARWVGPRIFGRPDAGYRVFVFEDGDRYVIRALCIFRILGLRPNHPVASASPTLTQVLGLRPNHPVASASPILTQVFEETERKHGFIVELLHDRSITGMRAASHLVGLALREMSDAGADSVRAWSLTHSGSFPIFARHAFVPEAATHATLRLGVRALDPSVAHVVEERGLWYLSGLDSERH